MTGGFNISRTALRAGMVAAVWLAAALLVPVSAWAGEAGPPPSWGASMSDARLQQIGKRLALANAPLCHSGESHCEGRLILSAGRDLNAWADGRNIVVSRPMMRFAGRDDELAFVVAHEMAHNLLGHAALLRSAGGVSRTSGEALAERAKHFEIEADVLAITLLANAGFDLNMPAPFIIRAMRGRKKATSTHPDTAGRLQAIRGAVLQCSIRHPEDRAIDPDSKLFHARSGVSGGLRRSDGGLAQKSGVNAG